MPVKILIVEDEVLIARDLKSKITRFGHDVVDVVYNSDHVTDKIMRHQPDLILLDINIEGSRNGIEMAHVINKEHQIPFVFITSYADQETIREVQATDPMGYIVKPFDENDIKVGIEMALFQLSKKVAKGFPSLEKLNERLVKNISPKEYEIILQLKEGLNGPEIANHHFISHNTVKSHIKRIYSKCDVHNRTELLNWCFAN